MSKLEEALQEKISALEDEKEELEDALARIDLKIETFQEILAEETGEEAPAPKKRGRPKKAATKAAPKKRGRPRKKNPEDEKNKALYEEAVGSLPGGTEGTTDEQQEQAIKRFNPTPRPAFGGTGSVSVGSTKGRPVNAETDPQGHRSISMEDDIPEEE